MENQKLIIDVREADEFKRERVEGSLHLPLSQLELVAPGALTPLRHCSVTILCRSGGRARIAREKLLEMGLLDPSRAEVFSGGILEWKKQGKPTIGANAGALPLMRQVQLVAGLMVFVGSLLAIFSGPEWMALPLFVGAGLSVAGATGFCGMALLLQRMPWNRVRQSSQVAPCATKN